jgi:hypothetical protein
MKNSIRKDMASGLATALVVFAPLASNAQSEWLPDADTVILWHLNEGSGSTTADAAPVLGGSNNGTISPGDTIWTSSGRFGNGLLSTANYTTGYLGTTPIGSGLFAGQKFTLDAWIKPTSIDAAGGSYIMGFDDMIGGAAGAFFRLEPGGNNLRFAVFNVISGFGYTQTDLLLNVGAGVNMLDGTWRHVAATYDNQTMKIFLDGVELGSTTTQTYFQLAEPLRFTAAGSRGWNPDAADGYRYMGYIDEIRVSNIARTEFSVVPEPSAFALAGLGGLGLFWRLRRRV